MEDWNLFSSEVGRFTHSFDSHLHMIPPNNTSDHSINAFPSESNLSIPYRFSNQPRKSSTP